MICESDRKSVNWKIIYLICLILGDGLIQEKELQHVMRACMDENGMKFDEGEVDELTHALFHDATISDQNVTSNAASSSLSHPQNASGAPAAEEEGGNPANLGQGITFDALKAQLTKHEGLLQNLSISIDRWLVPPKVNYIINCRSNFVIICGSQKIYILIWLTYF